LTPVKISVRLNPYFSVSNYKGDFFISKATRLNGAIQAQELRVIDEDGRQLGVLTKREALQLAEERELDLVEISPEARPPVAKIVDWGKFNYQRTKQLQRNKRNTRSLDMKQMRFGLKIGEHDLNIKLSKVTQFLDDGHKVRMTIVYHGRELAHKDLGFKLADKVIVDFGDKIIVDQAPQFMGRQLNFVIRSNPAGRHLQPENK